MTTYEFDGRIVVIHHRVIPARIMSGPSREDLAIERQQVVKMLLDDGSVILAPRSAMSVATVQLSESCLEEKRRIAERLLSERMCEAKRNGIIGLLPGEVLDVVEAAFAKAAKSFADGKIRFDP